MPSTQILTEAQDSKVELVVYLVFSPEWGPRHCVFSDEDLQVSGGIHGIERDLEEKTYWFAQLGRIRGEPSPHGITLQESDISKLAEPLQGAWHTGRRNPAFAGSELERWIFKSAFRAVQRMLDSWKREEDRIVCAYALKELRMSSRSLVSLANALHSLKRVHDIVGITVSKHWYDPSWLEPHVPVDESVLEEYSFHVSLQVRWSAGKDLIEVGIIADVAVLTP